MNGINGYFSCHKCYNKGISINGMKYLGVEFKRRTPTEFYKDALRAVKLSEQPENEEQIVDVNGIRGLNTLFLLPFCMCTNSVIIDPMHTVMLGTVASFVGMWISKENSEEPFYIGDYLNIVNRRISELKLPHSETSRMPRSLDISTLSSWKAHECKLLLLYSPIIFEGISILND